MSLVINELSLKGFKDIYAFDSAVTALGKVLKELNDKFDIRIQDIYGKTLDKQLFVTNEKNFAQMIKEMKDNEYRRILLSLLTSLKKYDSCEKFLFIDEEKAEGAAYAYCENGVMISLKSRDDFCMENVDCTDVNGEIFPIRNTAEVAHIYSHADFVTVREYRPNDKHREKEYIRSSGESVSVMDLDNGTAQKVLNKAVMVNDRLYGLFNGSVYEFRKTIRHIYHGYKLKDDALDKHLKKRIVESAANQGINR